MHLCRPEGKMATEADGAVQTATRQERDGHVATIREHRVRYLLALKAAGRWNRDRGLLDLAPEVLVKATIKPIGMDDCRIGEAFEPALLRPHVGQDLRWLDKAASELGIE
jgi:hypothetical protein